MRSRKTLKAKLKKRFNDKNIVVMRGNSNYCFDPPILQHSCMKKLSAFADSFDGTTINLLSKRCHAY